VIDPPLKPPPSRRADVLSSLDRLSQATGGMEKSWYRCIFPFGVISLVIGVAGTAVTCAYNDLPQTKVVSVVLLVVGLLLPLKTTSPSPPFRWRNRRCHKSKRNVQSGTVTVFLLVFNRDITG
uniref:Uncharacterized protein n=1 Tax=Denticeps clupeoides TaxID=299321 RepID=A0AAY4B754_9TELE